MKKQGVKLPIFPQSCLHGILLKIFLTILGRSVNHLRRLMKFKLKLSFLILLVIAFLYLVISNPCLVTAEPKISIFLPLVLKSDSQPIPVPTHSPQPTDFPHPTPFTPQI